MKAIWSCGKHIKNNKKTVRGKIKMYKYEKTEKHFKGSRSRDMFGMLFKPEREGKMPLMIISPELGYVWEDEVPYCEYFAENGIAVLAIDICGGGSRSRSEGRTTEMTILTNEEDVKAAVLEAMTWDFVDAEKVVLYGLSQGGLCAYLAARELQDRLAGLMLAYPGFAILDISKNTYKNPDEIPEVWNLNGWMDVCREYITDTLGMDAYAEFAKVKMPVLLMHGTRDSIFDLSFSERAAETNDNVEFHVIDGADHGFTKHHLAEVLPIMMTYMKKQGIIE